MENSESKGQNPAPPEASGDSKKAPDVGPLGRTRSEDQRRRLIIAGISTPGLMTLPSRRVWAAKCSKSKLMSGNLSANKKGTDIPKLSACDALGCMANDWKNKIEYRKTLDNWDDELFDGFFSGDVYQENGIVTLAMALDEEKPSDSSTWSSLRFTSPDKDKEVLDKLKKAAKEFAAGYLNAFYISNPDPNHIFNFQLTVAEVLALWDDGSWMEPEWDPDGLDPAAPAFVTNFSAAVTAGAIPTPSTYSQQVGSVVSAALEGGYWAKWYSIFKQAEKDGLGYKDEKEAAEELLKQYCDQIEDGNQPSFTKSMKDINEDNKACPF